MSAVDVVTASAGTGKTYRLVEEAIAALDRGVAPEELAAVTFTNRAAAELVERLRTRLLELGRPQEAERLLAARIGTVHAVFGDLLREFALEAGRSPVVQVLAEESGSRMFAAAADAAIAGCAAEMEEFAARFWPKAGRDWRDMVREVVELACANGVGADALPAHGARSWATLQAYLSPADERGAAALDAQLLAALTAAIRALEQKIDSKGTHGALDAMKEAASTLGRRPASLPWAEWARLTKLAPGKPAQPVVAPVIAAASAHLRHPRLHADLHRFIELLFACAARAMGDYRRWKDERGVVDFSDQEATALELLGLPTVRDALRERIGALLVDEFQDTSPIQLALFTAMTALVRGSAWVGDPKQAIYGFRRTDPELMDAVARQIPSRTDGRTHRLEKSWRSRPGLVRFFDDLFVPAFAPLGMERAQVALECANRTDAAGQPYPLAVLPLDAKNAGEESEALARGIVAMIRRPEEWLVVPKGQEAARPLRPGDIAVLCRRNERCAKVADALEALGIRAAIGRPGLLGTFEAVVAVAALRWAADGSDRLALAELASLTGDMRTDWLAAALSGRASDDLERLVAAAPGLRALRGQLLHLTPSEAMDAAIEAAEVARLAAARGRFEARLANLEALRALARQYEDECAGTERPATAGGLCAWFAGLEAERPPNPDPDAVKVLTCHGAKGLEWPLVVLSDLGEPPDARVFDQAVAEQDAAPDIGDPLAGRWLRFWPWPYDKQRKNVGLDQAVDQGAEARTAEQRRRNESIRLLYVAMTRARDYLVLAPRRQGGACKAGWLDRLVDVEGAALLRLPRSQDDTMRVGSAHHPVRVLGTELAGATEAEPGAVWLGPPMPADPVLHPPLRLRPSEAVAAGPVGFEVIALGPRLPLVGTPDMERLGEAFHSFIGADDRSRAAGERTALAAACLSGWSVAGCLTPEAFVEAADRLWRWCDETWPGSTIEREVPVTGRRGDQRIAGRIDMLVRAPGGLALMDHKTFPGGRDRWPDRMAAIAPQLDAYAEVCREAGAAVLGCYVHLPVSGVVLRLRSATPMPA